eukprot:COSAG01_NODE_771_length_13718_cov_54.441442_16_plen_38_part_00
MQQHYSTSSSNGNMTLQPRTVNFWENQALASSVTADE